MDNLTHSLVGLAAAKAGLEKLSPGTTTLCVLAASAADADIVALIFGGRWTFLHHHRGITHSIVGTLALALALPLIFYLVDLLIARVRVRPRSIKLKGLLLASLLVSATHPLLDWANSYGVRLLLPWNARWFYGDLVFIVDPFLWLILGGAVFLLTSKNKKQLALWLVIALITTYLVVFGPATRAGLANAGLLRLLWITGLVAFVILFKKQSGARWGAKIPVGAFTVVVIYLAGLLIVHSLALRRAEFEAARIANENSEHVIQVAAMPTLANPLHWVCVLETERAAYRFELGLLGRSRSPSNLVRYEKPDPSRSPAVAEAARDSRSTIFLGFARFPVVRVLGEDCATQTLVQFADLRYTEPGSDRGTFALNVPVECPLQRAMNTDEQH
ncbi:MAG TPA: hypothetical protein DHU55_01655 [Blastocatellia bacterium]|jgi:inner membrane protein|nr:hypothetical protein [Blastocatellia bacterium]HCX28471.1 hypothetical protein [Blastocatellia bacterium]